MEREQRLTGAAARPPRRGYLLCASPRSGSTLLCDLLAQTRTAGAPESYFRPGSIPQYAERWAVELHRGRFTESYLEAARHAGEAQTGCFGMRIMWGDTPAFLEQLAAVYPDPRNDRDRLRHALGVDTFIHLSREDMVAQAVSLVIANQSGLWHRNHDGSERQRAKPHEAPRYDREQIASELLMLQDEAAGWSRWFLRNDIEPLTLTYDELAADPIAVLPRIVTLLGHPAAESVTPGTARMADEINAEWSARFRAESELR